MGRQQCRKLNEPRIARGSLLDALHILAGLFQRFAESCAFGLDFRMQYGSMWQREPAFDFIIANRGDPTSIGAVLIHVATVAVDVSLSAWLVRNQRISGQQ